MVKDTTLQIFLTIYHGSLLATFLYDYVIRSVVRMFQEGQARWDYLTNTALGLVFMVVIVWLVLSVWAKIRTNLMISLVVLIIMFIVRASVGIPNMMGKKRLKFFCLIEITHSRLFISNIGRYRQNKEEIAIFTAQLIVHALGIVATGVLARMA